MRLQADQARVKEFLHYDETTGVFSWKKSKGNVKVGAIAGWLSPNRYLYISLDGKLLRAHRLAWLYVHGVMPPDEIDHVNGDKGDNRIANLRLATRSENVWNSRPRKSASGLKGAYPVRKRKRIRWASAIRKDGKRVHLGYFATPEEAHAVYVKAAAELFGEFARIA